MKKGKVYEILWKDTYAYNGWYDEDEINDLTSQDTTTSVGYFIKEKNGYVILVQGIEKHKDFKPYRSPVWIPKGYISAIKELK